MKAEQVVVEHADARGWSACMAMNSASRRTLMTTDMAMIPACKVVLACVATMSAHVATMSACMTTICLSVRQRHSRARRGCDVQVYNDECDNVSSDAAQEVRDVATSVCTARLEEGLV